MTNWGSQYLRAIYYVSSTFAIVGYGDISGTNRNEYNPLFLLVLWSWGASYLIPKSPKSAIWKTYYLRQLSSSWCKCPKWKGRAHWKLGRSRWCWSSWTLGSSTTSDPSERRIVSSQSLTLSWRRNLSFISSADRDRSSHSSSTTSKNVTKAVRTFSKRSFPTWSAWYYQGTMGTSCIFQEKRPLPCWSIVMSQSRASTSFMSGLCTCSIRRIDFLLDTPQAASLGTSRSSSDSNLVTNT